MNHIGTGNPKPDRNAYRDLDALRNEQELLRDQARRKRTVRFLGEPQIALDEFAAEMKRYRVGAITNKVVPDGQVEFVVTHQQENSKECHYAQDKSDS